MARKKKKSRTIKSSPYVSRSNRIRRVVSFENDIENKRAQYKPLNRKRLAIVEKDKRAQLTKALVADVPDTQYRNIFSEYIAVRRERKNRCKQAVQNRRRNAFKTLSMGGSLKPKQRTYKRCK